MLSGPGWEVLLRGAVSHALQLRGCRRGWTLSSFRGQTRLNITARAGGGARHQLLLPYPWESQSLEDIREAVIQIYEAFLAGVPFHESLALLNEQTRVRRLKPSSASPSEQGLTPEPVTPGRITRAEAVDWPALIQHYKTHKLNSGEIKASTWERHYTPKMQLLREAFHGAVQPRDAGQLLELQAIHWRYRPGCRARRMQVQYCAAFLRWAVSQRMLDQEWTPPPDLSSYVGRSRESKAITTPISIDHVLAMVSAIPDPRWRLAFQLLAAFGLRPEELLHLQNRSGRLWCTYEKVASRGKTRPRILRLLPSDTWAEPWRLAETFDPLLLPPLRPGYGSDSISRYLLRRPLWQDLRRDYEARGEKLVLYSCRHGYAHRAHVICDLPPKVVAAAMGHSLQTHLAAYSRWCGDDVVDDAFAKAQQRIHERDINPAF